MYKVYIIRSEKNGMRYIGYTRDIDKRLKEHNSGKTRSIKNKGPWKLIYQETEFKSREEAIKRERELKKMKGGIQLKELLKKAGIV